ncbi:MAG TPA: hypothetical protein VIC53_06880 [Wenzhouxiangella sp.]
MLFVPALDQWLANAPSIPAALQRWLSLGAEETFLSDAYLAELVLDKAIAPAALNAWIDGITPGQGTLIQIDLVSLQPDLNAVWAQPSAALADDQTCTALHALFADFGFSLEQASGGRMYVLCPQAPQVVFTPLWQIQGVSIDQLMPSGPDAKRWIGLISESQILLHQLKAQGATTAGDSIWPWGMGEVPEHGPPAPRLHSMRTTSPEFQELGDWLRLPVVGPEGEPCLSAGELVEWRGQTHCSAHENLINLNAMLKSLMRRLRWGRLKRVELATQTSRWVLTPAQLWKGLS